MSIDYIEELAIAAYERGIFGNLQPWSACEEYANAAEYVARLERENAELRKDAARYRWIKCTASVKSYPENAPDSPFYFHGIGHVRVGNLDAAIDAALQPKEPNNVK